MTAPLSDEQRALCMKHARLAGGASRPWRHAWQWLWDDIEGAANLALVRAASTWDESSGITFESYAYYRIRRAAWGVVDLERRRAAGHDDGAAEWVPDTDLPGWERVDDDDAFEVMLRPLPARSRKVVRMIYRADLNCTEVARKIGLSRETVSRIHSSALARLAATLDEGG
jgi:RNA polymerase sigma factor (sigma-70 family)